MPGSHNKYTVNAEDIDIKLEGTPVMILSAVVDGAADAIKKLDKEVESCTKSFDEFKPGIFSRYNDHVDVSIKKKINPILVEFKEAMDNYEEEIKSVPNATREGIHLSLMKLKQDTESYLLSVISKKANIDPAHMSLVDNMVKEVSSVFKQETQSLKIK